MKLASEKTSCVIGGSIGGSVISVVVVSSAVSTTSTRFPNTIAQTNIVAKKTPIATVTDMCDFAGGRVLYFMIMVV